MDMIDVASRSAIIINCLWNQMKLIPWKIRSFIKEIQVLCQNHDIHFIHCLQEVNSVADLLSSIGYQHKKEAIFNLLGELPPNIKGSILLVLT